MEKETAGRKKVKKERRRKDLKKKKKKGRFTPKAMQRRRAQDTPTLPGGGEGARRRKRKPRNPTKRKRCPEKNLPGARQLPAKKGGLIGKKEVREEKWLKKFQNIRQQGGRKMVQGRERVFSDQK